MYSEYDDIVARLNQGRLWDFPGGVHPPELKSLSNQNEIASIAVSRKLFVTVKQHIGVEGTLIVQEGDRVLKGQPLTKSMNPFSVPVHAPSSGIVSRIGKHVSAHPSGIGELTVEIDTDEFEKWVDLHPVLDYQQKPKAKIVEAICSAGISGMGGAGFPTHIKASPKKNVEFLIINGVECEPYISSDDRLMREHAWQIRQGIDVLVHLLSPKMVIVAIEDNKPEALEAMQVACQENAKYRVIAIPTKYPAGGEKQLIQVLTNREVPVSGLPIDVGVIMQNVGTCYAIADAIFSGKPLVERVVTLTGEAFKRPQNVWAPIGTPISHLLEIGHYREHKQRTPKLIMGGPMMGFELVDEQVPVVKITNCILAPASHEIQESAGEQPCIRCSACADACPASLLPQQLFWHSKAKEYDKSQEYNLFDCIECGACAYVCPSEIPLVHYYRVAKADIRAQEHEKDQADKARLRFEARKLRLEREQKEREEKHAKAAEARKKAMSDKGSGAKDKIAAALARAKAKKQNQTDANAVVQAGDSAVESKQDKVAAAIARAKAKRAEKQSATSEPANQESDSVPVVNEPKTESEPPAKQEKVAIAIAKAKAKRAAAKREIALKAAKTGEQTDDSTSEPAIASTESDKKQKIAAAVAKAKAKRANAKSQSSEQASQTSTQTVATKTKKAESKSKQTDTAPSVPKGEAQNKSDPIKPLTAAQIRKQKVEAAVAKAREKNLAKKAQRDAQKQNSAAAKKPEKDET